VLFQGDSITDCGRDRSRPDSVGGGYAHMVVGQYGLRHPGHSVTFLNRGISGNRVHDLLDRWQEDALALRPDVLSIFVGINNTWRRYDRNDPTPGGVFALQYRELLDRTRAALPGVALVLVEPFVVHVPADRRAWREDLDPKIDIIRRLAKEYAAIHVPLDRLFAEAVLQAEPRFWAPDGVHPSPAGHALIARAWLEAVGEGV